MNIFEKPLQKSNFYFNFIQQENDTFKFDIYFLTKKKLCGEMNRISC